MLLRVRLAGPIIARSADMGDATSSRPAGVRGRASRDVYGKKAGRTQKGDTRSQTSRHRWNAVVRDAPDAKTSPTPFRGLKGVAESFGNAHAPVCATPCGPEPRAPSAPRVAAAGPHDTRASGHAALGRYNSLEFRSAENWCAIDRIYRRATPGVQEAYATIARPPGSQPPRPSHPLW